MLIIHNLFRLNLDLKCLPISTNLPPKYLSVQSFGLGKGVNFILFYFTQT